MFKWLGKKIEKFTTIFHGGVVIEKEADGTNDLVLNVDVTEGSTVGHIGNISKIKHVKTAVTGAGEQGGSTLLELSGNDSAANNGAATITNTGLYVSLNKTSTSESPVQTGIAINVIGGTSSGTFGPYTTGIASWVKNGGADIVMHSSADDRDYCAIATTANGATTITTKDYDAALAHFEIEADGDITLDSVGQIKLEPGADNNILLDNTITVDAGVVTGATSITSEEFVGPLTGQADTVATIAGLAPNTATTQATQGNITTCSSLSTVGSITTGTWRGTSINTAYMDAATALVKGAVELATADEAIDGTDTTRAITAAGLKATIDKRYSYQYISFSFKATNIAPDTWVTPSDKGPEYWQWDANLDGQSDAPKDVDIETTITVDYLEQSTGFVIPKTCKLDGFYGNSKVNGTSPNTLRPVIGFFRAAEPADGNQADLTATCVAFDSYDTASGNRRNRFLKLESLGLNTTLTQGDILFPAVGFDATAGDSNGDMWGSYTIVLKTLIP